MTSGEPTEGRRACGSGPTRAGVNVLAAPVRTAVRGMER
jgi:hypothetical protein